MKLVVKIPAAFVAPLDDVSRPPGSDTVRDTAALATGAPPEVVTRTCTDVVLPAPRTL